MGKTGKGTPGDPRGFADWHADQLQFALGCFMDEDPIFSVSFEWWETNVSEWLLGAETLMSGGDHAASEVEKLAQLTEVLADGAAFWGVETVGLNRFAVHLADSTLSIQVELLRRSVDIELGGPRAVLRAARQGQSLEGSLDWLLQFDRAMNRAASMMACGQALGGCYQQAREAVRALSSRLVLERESGFVDSREKVLASRDVETLLQRRLELGMAVQRVTSAWQERLALSGDRPGSDGLDRAAVRSQDPLEPFVLYRGPNTRVELDGRVYPLSDEQARIVQVLSEAKGSIVEADRLRKYPGSNEDPGKTIRRMPQAIQDLIKARPGQGGGRRLLTIPLIIQEP